MSKVERYLVLLKPEKDIPRDGWDSTLVQVKMYVMAPNSETAREMAEITLRLKGLHCKAVYCRKIMRRLGR